MVEEWEGQKIGNRKVAGSKRETVTKGDDGEYKRDRKERKDWKAEGIEEEKRMVLVTYARLHSNKIERGSLNLHFP
jgi:hypothetical protein